MAVPGLSEIVTTTIESRNKYYADNVSNTNALLSAIKKAGGYKTFSGGSVIMEEFSSAENPNVSWYSGYDTLNLNAGDSLTSATFTIKQLAAPVVMSGLEALQNSGKEKMIDLLDARLSIAEQTLYNTINKGLYSDGTANGGKQITGLKAAVSLTPTTGIYGAIDRATSTVWRNQKMKGAGTDFALTLDKTTIFANMLTMFNKLVRGADKPDLIIMDENYYGIYMSSLTADMRFSDVDTANRGFMNVTFMGVPVVMEPQASGMPANTAYFLNTKYLKFRPHKDRNFVPLELGRSPNQDAETHAIAWAGNLTSNGPRFQGVLAD